MIASCIARSNELQSSSSFFFSSRRRHTRFDCDWSSDVCSSDLLENVTGGNLGAEARMGIVFSEGVMKRRMSLQRFADVTATNAARILGLYPQKGVIAPGSDADLVLIDPAIRKTLAREDFHVSDYSPWEGWPIQGWPVTTILRGRVVVEHGRLVGDALDGRLVRRRIAPEVLRRPAC